MPRAPMKPHKKQDGFVYVRLSRDFARSPMRVVRETLREICAAGGESWQFYSDNCSWQRIISSRRTEEAVELADYLKRCDENGFIVTRFSRTHWTVQGILDNWKVHTASTLRKAYRLCKHAQAAS